MLTYTAQYQSQQPRPRTSSKDTRKPEPEPTLVRPLLDFRNSSEYIMDFPPVLLVRVTPKMVEGLDQGRARGRGARRACRSPPIKRITSGFARLRAFCGDAEVTHIHPFMLELRMSEDEAIYEGLYVFDPGALGPHCGTVKLVLCFREGAGEGRYAGGRPESRRADLAGFRTLSRRDTLSARPQAKTSVATLPLPSRVTYTGRF